TSSSSCGTHLHYVLDSPLLRQHLWYFIQRQAISYKFAYALWEQDHELFKVLDCRQVISAAGVYGSENDFVPQHQIAESAADFNFGRNSFGRNSGKTKHSICFEHLSRGDHQRCKSDGLEYNVESSPTFCKTLDRIGR